MYITMFRSIPFNRFRVLCFHKYFLSQQSAILSDTLSVCRLVCVLASEDRRQDVVLRCTRLESFADRC